MASISTNLALHIWDQNNDFFSHTELADNFQKIDVHDHTGSGKGLAIPETGIANNAITAGKIKDGEVIAGKLGPSSVVSSNIKDATIQTSDIGQYQISADRLAILPYAVAQTTAPVTTTHNAFRIIPWNSTIWDTTTPRQWPGGGSTQLVCRQPGAYLIWAYALFAAGPTTGRRTIAILKSGQHVAENTVAASTETGPLVGTNAVGLNTTAIWRLGANEVVEVRAFQTSGANLVINEALFGIAFLSP
jgi:hypothetical protein